MIHGFARAMRGPISSGGLPRMSAESLGSIPIRRFSAVLERAHEGPDLAVKRRAVSGQLKLLHVGRAADQGPSGHCARDGPPERSSRRDVDECG